MNTLIAASVTFVACFIVLPVVLALARAFGFYVMVNEGECRVYVLFGKVLAVLDEPGLHFLLTKLGWRAPIVNWLGRCHVLDMRLDQEYLRSQPVNSEEGAPMGARMLSGGLDEAPRNGERWSTVWAKRILVGETSRWEGGASCSVTRPGPCVSR